ncbi:hypothetical protein FRC10_011418 [Ceratobasidium sp. 414]|nr:hypothetical protein FRC10_011418 [Ceratobasidium sp. 414]
MLKAIECHESGEANIYKINQLEAMELAVAAWKQVSPSTITNCWRHTKLSGPKPDPDDLPTICSAPTMSSEVQDSVSALQQTLGSFYMRSMVVPIEPMHAKEFLLADADLPTEQELTDDEIVEQVKEEERQATGDGDGQFFYEEDASESASQPPVNHVDSQSRSKAAASLEDVQAFLARFGPLNPSDLAALSSLQQKIATFETI